MLLLRAFCCIALLGLAGCYNRESHGSTDVCDVRQTKRDVLALVRQNYLWHDQLPPKVDPDAHADPKALLQVLTAPARSQEMDRNFSAMSTKEDSGDSLNSVQAVGFGSEFCRRDGRIFIRQVYRGSGADRAGLARGDELIAVASTRPGLDAPGSQMSALSASKDWKVWEDANSRPGNSLFCRIRKADGGVVLDLAISSSRFPMIDAVPDAGSPTIFEPGGGHKVGYVMLKTFIKPAEEPLRQVMGRFRQAGVTDLIVDFRYNTGGLMSTANVLLNLLGGNRGSGDVMFKLQRNPDQSQKNETFYFRPEANALAPGRIAFIVTGDSASASETVVSSLHPYYGRNLALIGGRTCGKPVGQVPFFNPSCDWVLWLVAFHVRNALDQGEYFQGLPDRHFTGISQAVEDDLGHAPGDPAEACTAAALRWIATGINPGPPIPEPRKGKPAVDEGPQFELNRAFRPGLF